MPFLLPPREAQNPKKKKKKNWHPEAGTVSSGWQRQRPVTALSVSCNTAQPWSGPGVSAS